MFTFSDYRSLHASIKAVCNQLWVCEILLESGAPNINALPLYLEERGDNRNARSRQTSKYWYKKYHGESLRTDVEVIRIERLLPGTAKILYHPLWRLLDMSEPNELELIQLASELPFDIQKQILSKDRTRIRPPRYHHKLLMEQNFDGLTAILLLYLNNKTSDKARDYFSMGASLILRLFASRYINADCGFNLYALLIQQIEKYNNVLRISRLKTGNGEETFADLQMPLAFNICTTADHFKKYRTLYTSVIDLIIDRLDFIDAEQEATKLMALVPHSQLHEFEWNLQIYPEHKIPGRTTWLERALYCYKK